MTKRQQKAVQRYVDSLLPKLGLTDWCVDVVQDAGEDQAEGALAVCHKHHARRDALIWFREDFCGLVPDFQRRVIVHELLHVVHAPEEQYVFTTLADHLPPKKHALISDTFRLLHEYAVDSLAVAIAPLFPLPRIPR
jgi:hypothetical protein